MRNRKLLAAAATVAVGALALAGCTPQAATSGSPGAQSTLSSNATATVAWNQAFYSYNTESSFGNATANSNIGYATNDRIAYYDQDLKFAQNPSFGRYEKISDNPLKVKITLADTATWSDNTPVTAADVVLAWAAQSTNYNTYEAKTDENSGVGQNAANKVFFNGADTGLALIKEFPEIGDNNKSVTFTYSKPFVDWEVLAAVPVYLPAHVVAKRALGTADPAAAQQALLDAFKNKDNAALSKVSNVWNSDFNFKTMPSDKELVVSTGPFTISDLKENQYVTLTKNPNYKGDHKPGVDTVTVRFIEDPQASVQALQNGEVLATQPQATADIKTQLDGLQGVTTTSQPGATYEHIDLVFTNGGPFDPKSYGGDKEKAESVRKAFLTAIPRQKILDTIIKPLDPEAQLRNSLTVVPSAPNYPDMVRANGMEAAYGGGDPAKAKQMLAAAGVTTTPNVRFLYANNNPRRVQQYQLIKEAAEQAGFRLEDKGNKNWGEELEKPGTYDASMFGWQSESLAVSESEANFRTKGQNNYGGYSNAEVDKLFDQLQVAVDPAQQKTILEQVEKILVDDGFGVSIYQFPEIMGVSDKITGVSSTAIAPTMFWNVWEWKLA